MKLGQAELVVIDEAAAIPLPYVRKLLGPYLVFMASTINGYEGTGRSLSLKLINSLRQQTSGVGGGKGKKSSSSSSSGSFGDGTTASSAGGRSLKELALQDPIRYGSGDPVEQWLNQLLCLDATLAPALTAQTSGGCPHPAKCQLYYVNRDTLFSFHKASETFLQRMMALYVSSHYKNTPNDLQLMSDAPAHHLFVLLGEFPPFFLSLCFLPAHFFLNRLINLLLFQSSCG
jgi:N-acetyltransferase 10